MSAVLEEARQARVLMDRVEKLERVAETLPEGDDRRDTLFDVIRDDLESAPPMRPRIAAELLKLSEKTIRAWITEGVLRESTGTGPRTLLDPQRVHQVLQVVTALRREGRAGPLLDEVFRRLVDETWLERGDLLESLEQMKRGEGITRVARPQA